MFVGRMAPGVVLLAILLIMRMSFSEVFADFGGGLARRLGDAVITGASKTFSHGDPAVSEAFSHGDSATTLYSSENYLKCTSTHHVTPTSTNEIGDLIRRYTSLHEHVKIRATRRGFHSSAGFVCSGRRGSSKPEFRAAADQVETGDDPTVSVTVLMQFMNRVVEVDSDRRRITVEAGMTLLDLTKAAEVNAMSVPAGALSVYANLTVGGVILASGHGSGLGTISSLADLVTKVKWVNANGKTTVSDLETERGAKEARAFVGGLGLLGIVTEFTLQLQPNSRTIVETRKGLSDANIAADLMKTLETETPHVIAFWRPDFGTYKMVTFKQVNHEIYDDPTTPKFYPNGKIAYLTPIDGTLSSAWSELMATWEEDAGDESASADVMNAAVCDLAKMLHEMDMFEDGDGNIIDHGTIPTNFAVVSDDCSPRCLYYVHHMGTFIEDTEFTIKLSQLEDWIADAKKVMTTELAEIEARLSRRYGKHVTRCMPPGYFWIRFGQPNRNLLSTATGSEPLAYVQWLYMHSAKRPNGNHKLATIAETLEQITLCKYRGRPHWGKNHERTFRHPRCKVRDNFPAANIAAMVEMQREHDSRRVFEPELFRHLLEGTGPEYRKHCSAHFWCYCEEDAHCPHGHACRPSATFPEYNICTVLHNSDTTDENTISEL